MKHLKMLSLTAIMVMGLMALAGVSAAQAAFYTDSAKTVKYATGTVVDLSLKSGSTMRLTNGAETLVTCSESTAKGKSSEAGETVTVSLETLTWGGCSTTTDTLAKGKLEVTWTSGSNGEVIGQESKWTVSIFGVSCTYGFGEGVKLGTLAGGETPTLNIEASIPRTAGGALCPSAVTWDAEYVVTEPHALYVGPVPLTSLYTDAAGTIKYPAETTVDLSLKTGTSALLETTSGAEIATCTESTAKGKAGAEAGKATPVNLETLTWGGCNQTTDNLALGSLEISKATGDSGTIVGKNTSVTLGVFGVSCVYGTAAEGTTLGTIGGGSAPQLAINAVLPKKEGGFLCPSSGRWTATYVVTEPHALHFEPTYTSLYTDAAETVRYPAETTVDLSLKAGVSALLETTSNAEIATCTESTAKGKAEKAEVGKATPVSLETLTWGGCNQTTDDLAFGRLEISKATGDSGTVVGKNTSVTLGVFGVSCVYGTAAEGTHLGTISGGSAPELVINTVLPKKEGGFLCPSSGRWTATYVVTEPHALHF